MPHSRYEKKHNKDFRIGVAIKQNESKVSNDTLLVSDYFYTLNTMQIDFETRHFRTPTILRKLKSSTYSARSLDLCYINLVLATSVWF